MNAGAKVALALLGLGIAGGAIWYFTQNRGGTNMLTSGGAPTGGSSSPTTSPNQGIAPSKYEGKIVSNANAKDPRTEALLKLKVYKLYLVMNGQKRLIPTYETYQSMVSQNYPKYITITDAELKSIPDGIPV